MLEMTSFSEVAILLMMAAGVGLIGLLLRQPLIVSFIAVGLLAGPSALDVVQSDAQIGLLSELGIALLLFLVGIKLDVKLVRSLGAVSVLTGLGQVGFTALFGFTALAKRQTRCACCVNRSARSITKTRLHKFGSAFIWAKRTAWPVSPIRPSKFGSKSCGRNPDPICCGCRWPNCSTNKAASPKPKRWPPTRKPAAAPASPAAV
jgi:hypothetical protein